jgi:hypothetical protein
MARFGEQLDALFEQVERARVHVVVFDDLRADPGKVYREVLDFLALPDDGRSVLPVRNENREFRHAWAQPLVVNPPRPVATALEAWQRRGHRRPRWVRALRRRVKEWNTRKAARPAMAPALRARLRLEFAEDIEHLGALLGRDLSHWR